MYAFLLFRSNQEKGLVGCILRMQTYVHPYYIKPLLQDGKSYSTTKEQD